MAEDYGLIFLETSAMANINVEDAFVGLAKQVKQRVATEEKKSGAGATNSSIKLSNVPGQSYISSCCYGGGGSGDSKKKNGK
jgi:hypothetical protein